MEDGTIILEPRELTAPFQISVKTLAMMDAKELKTVADDYDALCSGFGREMIAARVQAIREQENAERMQRRTRRRHEIEVR